MQGISHLEGRSKKNGKEYNVNVVHYLGRSMGVEGQAALTDVLDAVKYPYDSLTIGNEYIIEHDRNGNLLIFEPVVKQVNTNGR